MSNRNDPRKALLDRICSQVEMTLAAHHAPGFIAGGTHSPDLIQLYFTPAVHIRPATVLALLPVLSAALGWPVDGERGESSVILRMATPATATRQTYALEVGQ